jgi:hypothetical protein
LEGEPVVSDTLKVSANVLHSFFVAGAWAMGKSSALMDSKLDFWVSI